eukprot:gene3619-3963_t
MEGSTHHLIGYLEPIPGEDNVLDGEDLEGEGSKSHAHGKVHRRLTFIDGVAIIVGIIIGSGIFSSPGLALERAGSPGMVLLAWALSGLLVTLTAQCYLELGGMMPSAGGDFDYLRRAYGEAAAFSFAWFNFFVSKTGSQAIIATIFGRYFESVLRGNASQLIVSGSTSETWLSKVLAVAVVVGVTALNCAGVKESAVVSILLTSTKVLLVLSVFVFAILYASSDKDRSETARVNLSVHHSFDGSKDLFSFATSMVACLWCFDGYADGNFLQEEMINPIQDLPRIIRFGLLLVTCCYILTNIGYLAVLSVDTIEDTKAIAVQFGTTVSDMFSTGKTVLPIFFAVGVSLSTLGSLNGSIMAGGRAFFAVARAGKFPRSLAKVNLKGSPYVSLIAQGVWSVVLLLLPGSNFASLLDYFGPTSWLFYAISASSVIVLRYREPHVLRPFVVPFYPLPPIIVIGIAIVIVLSSLLQSPLYTLLAMGFVMSSFPVHMVMERYGCFLVKDSPERAEHDSNDASSKVLNGMHQRLPSDEL